MEKKKFHQNFPHDAIYKVIFSEKALIKSLLLDFVKLPSVKDFDFSTLELFPANYSTPAFSRHENDLVWRIDTNGRACIIFLMLEFQSQPERWMAARIGNYANLLISGLISNPPPDFSLERGLPPILPIVIYNGQTRWGAPLNMTELFMPMPEDLREFRAGQKYLLLDIRHMAENMVQEAHGEASYFVRLERSKSTQETLAIIRDVIKNCSGQEFDRLRRLLRNFIICCQERGSWHDDLDRPMPLEEFEMLYDNYPKWATVEWENGLDEGIKEGRQEGIKEGRQEGIKEGRQEGKKEERALIMASLEAKLIERFGSLPNKWTKLLAEISDPARIIELTGAAYTAATAQEFEATLVGRTRL